MKITKGSNDIMIEFGKFYVQIYEAWSQIFGCKNYNWITFDFFKFTVEWDKWVGNVEVDISVLGFSLMLVIQVPNKKSKKLFKYLDSECKKNKRDFIVTGGKK